MDRNLLKKLKEEKEKLLDSITRSEMKHLDNKSIMVIDDSEETIFMMSTFLKKTGQYNVKTFVNEFEALEEIAKQAPDLIVLDVMLKNTDGIKFAKAVGGLDVFRGPIVFISSNANFHNDIIQTFGANTHFMAKPLDTTKFTNLIVELLK
ncbi:MAG: response regulator [Bacteriovoracaceae bacterium]|nr:response regulator [Bacteriovoracaceae bacterium]